MPALEALGWTPWFSQHFAPHAAEGRIPGRIVSAHNELYRVLSNDAERLNVVESPWTLMV